MECSEGFEEVRWERWEREEKKESEGEIRGYGEKEE
jgi:hypothetical protein